MKNKYAVCCVSRCDTSSLTYHMYIIDCSTGVISKWVKGVHVCFFSENLSCGLYAGWLNNSLKLSSLGATTVHNPFGKEESISVVRYCKCCGSGMFINPDPGSHNSNKRGGEKISCPTFFVATNRTKLKIILFLNKYRKKHLSQCTKNYSTFCPKYCHWALKNMGLVSGIRDQRSWIRVRGSGIRDWESGIWRALEAYATVKGGNSWTLSRSLPSPEATFLNLITEAVVEATEVACNHERWKFLALKPISFFASPQSHLS